MATSGNVSFTRTRDQIIYRACRLTHEIASGETTISNDLLEQGAEALNAMVKHWQLGGLYIWRTEEVTLFLQKSQRQYSLSSTSTDHATRSYTETSLASAAASGASTIVVGSATGIATGYYIGVELDDGTLDWTTVNGAPAGTTVTLTATLDSAASSGNRVLVYQTKLVRPLAVISAREYNYDSTIETPLELMDRIQYQETPNKASTGTPNGIFYDRRGGANASGLLYVWPTPSTVASALKMTVARPIEDFSSASDEPDIPQEWIRMLTWNLADELTTEHSTPEPDRSTIKEKAGILLADANWWESELTEVQFIPDMGR